MAQLEPASLGVEQDSAQCPVTAPEQMAGVFHHRAMGTEPAVRWLWAPAFSMTLPKLQLLASSLVLPDCPGLSLLRGLEQAPKKGSGMSLVPFAGYEV